MRSSFSSRASRRRRSSGADILTDETYDLKGLNLVAPDQIMPAGETPFAINNRRFADNEDETSVAMRTRQGSTRLSTPVGETLNVQNTATATSDIVLLPSNRIAFPFTPSASGALTKFTIRTKKTLNTRGYLIVEIYSDALSLPSQVIGQTSIAPSFITESYADVDAFLIDAPALISGTQYWAVVSMQDLGVGEYYLAASATGLIQSSTDGMKTWNPTVGGVRFKTYLSTAGLIKGFTKRYPQNATTGQDNVTMFALGTKLYKMPDSPAVPAEMGTNLIHTDSTKVRFEHIDKWSFEVDGVNKMKWTEDAVTWTDVPNQTTALGPPINVMQLENRLLTVPKGDPNRIEFSALYDFQTWPSVNFLYIGRPKSADTITAWQRNKTGATVFTQETKYTLQGTNLQNFQPIPHVGTKGAVSQEATAVGTQGVYFLSDDLNIYLWNGVNDKLISFKVGPELRKILDPLKVRFHIYKNQLRVYYNKNPDTDVTRMLIYDIEQDEWALDTGRPVMGSMEWVYDNNELIEFSSKAGALYLGETGYSDMGKAIDYKYWTAYKLYGSGASKKRVKRFRPIVRPANSAYYLKVGKDVDFQNTPQVTDWLVDSGGAKWGTFNWGDGTVYGGDALIDNRAAMSGRGKHIQYRFEHKGIDQPVEMYGYIALVKIGKKT